MTGDLRSFFCLATADAISENTLNGMTLVVYGGI